MTASCRALIVSWDGGGNVPPALNLGALLAREGPTVRVVGWETMATRVFEAGLDFTSYPSMRPLPTGVRHEDIWEERIAPALHGHTTRDDIIAEAKEFDADVLLIDCMMDAGFEAARELGLPSVVLLHLLPSFFTCPWGDEAVPTQRALLLEHADEVLAFVPPGFDVSCPLPRRTSFVGPLLPPRPRPPLRQLDAELLASPGDPWVLLSLSTAVQGQVEALPAMLEAVSTLPVRVLLTLGGALPTRAVDAPANVFAREFIPHDLVLPFMTTVISHAGLSTIMAALVAGVPLLCIPQGRDQHYNAERVAAAGVGRSISTEASAMEIARALLELMADQATQCSARRVANELSALGGGDIAVKKVLGLCKGADPTRCWQDLDDG